MEETPKLEEEVKDADEKAAELIEYLVATNEKNYNYLKLAEELNELSEVLIKKITKEGGLHEPSEEKLVEEAGDVFLRLAVLMTMLGEEKVFDRINKKVAHLEERKDKYKGRL